MLPNMRSDKIVPVILIVEDEALVRLSAVGMLEDAGFRTIEAANGDQALELLAADSCQSAFKFGSDSISMKFTDGIGRFSKRNQRHANQFSDFCSRPRGSDC
jgi:CheY-like chemotaxis protein